MADRLQFEQPARTTFGSTIVNECIKVVLHSKRNGLDTNQAKLRWRQAQAKLNSFTSRHQAQSSHHVLGSISSSYIQEAEDSTESAPFRSDDDVFLPLRSPACRCQPPNLAY
ncbi:hypothetical protein FPHYL_5564 [Fusarium phyllophilum]|uniref:Uncharacterized protein n=1 Tax=Fusarium phyllophilum TaxID=47803 RepID=A0A8H5JYU9_9HYPO|nr:hypothetical protein FPHYL_5564 [Fusarium phyllophilum]